MAKFKLDRLKETYQNGEIPKHYTSYSSFKKYISAINQCRWKKTAYKFVLNSQQWH